MSLACTDAVGEGRGRLRELAMRGWKRPADNVKSSSSAHGDRSRREIPAERRGAMMQSTLRQSNKIIFPPVVKKSRVLAVLSM